MKVFLFLLILVSNVVAMADDDDDDLFYDDYKSLSHIPEPMVFDLVRPLGSKKGQWEANVLVMQEHATKLSDSHESPEIEYVLFDDLALELEIPGVGGEPEAVKGVLQWTLGHLGKKKNDVHGMQLIYQQLIEQNPHEEITPLYIYGYRFNQDYSILMMFGDQFRTEHSVSEHRLVVNATLFKVYSHVKDIEFGLENNLLGLGRNFEYWRVTPQIDLVLENHWKVQMGVGALYSYKNSWESSSGVRIVKEFY